MGLGQLESGIWEGVQPGLEREGLLGKVLAVDSVFEDYRCAREFFEDVNNVNKTSPYVEKLRSSVQIFGVGAKLDGNNGLEFLQSFKLEVLPKWIEVLKLDIDKKNEEMVSVKKEYEKECKPTFWKFAKLSFEPLLCLSAGCVGMFFSENCRVQGSVVCLSILSSYFYSEFKVCRWNKARSLSYYKFANKEFDQESAIMCLKRAIVKIENLLSVES